MTYTHFWECKCSHDKPFIHPLSQVGCVLCHATQEGQPRSSQENVDEFGVVPDLCSKLFIFCKRGDSPGCGPFVNQDWNEYWGDWAGSRFTALAAARYATTMNKRKSYSRKHMGYRVVRCLNQARIPTGWNHADETAEYETSNETGEYLVKTYQPIAKLGAVIDIDPHVILVWGPAAPAKS